MWKLQEIFCLLYNLLEVITQKTKIRKQKKLKKFLEETWLRNGLCGWTALVVSTVKLKSMKMKSLENNAVCRTCLSDDSRGKDCQPILSTWNHFYKNIRTSSLYISDFISVVDNCIDCLQDLFFRTINNLTKVEVVFPQRTP